MILDLFLAGTETTSTTLQWFFIYMMYNQGVQEKCRKEIQEVGNKWLLNKKELIPKMIPEYDKVQLISQQWT